MAGKATAAKAKVAGMVYRGGASATLPSDATSSLPTGQNGFTCLGDISEDGVSHNETSTSTDHKNMNGSIVYSSQTEFTDKFEFTLIDSLDTDVLKTIYGESNVTVGSGTAATDLEKGITVLSKGDEPTAYVWVFELILRDGVAKRIVIPSGKVTEMGEKVYKMDELVGYKITITASLASYGSDTVTHKEFIKKA